MAQLALARGSVEEAEETLAGLKLLRSLPGHAAALVALRHARGDEEGAVRALDEAVAACREVVGAASGDEAAAPALPTWSRGFGREATAPGTDETRTSLSPRAALVELMMASAAYRLRVGRNAEAVGALEELARGDAGPLRTDQRLSVTAATVLAQCVSLPPGSVLNVATLTLSPHSAHADPEKAEALADRLPQPKGAEALPSIDELLEGAARLRRQEPGPAASASQAPSEKPAAATAAPSEGVAAGAGAGTEVPAADSAVERTTQEVSEEKLACVVSAPLPCLVALPDALLGGPPTQAQARDRAQAARAEAGEAEGAVPGTAGGARGDEGGGGAAAARPRALAPAQAALRQAGQAQGLRGRCPGRGRRVRQGLQAVRRRRASGREARADDRPARWAAHPQRCWLLRSGAQAQPEAAEVVTEVGWHATGGKQTVPLCP